LYGTRPCGRSSPARLWPWGFEIVIRRVGELRGEFGVSGDIGRVGWRIGGSWRETVKRGENLLMEFGSKGGQCLSLASRGSIACIRGTGGSGAEGREVEQEEEGKLGTS